MKSIKRHLYNPIAITAALLTFGERLKTELAQEGVKLDLMTTGGTVDNLALLNEPNSGVDFAMVQGGSMNAVLLIAHKISL